MEIWELAPPLITRSLVDDVLLPEVAPPMDERVLWLGLLVLATHVPLGRRVLARGIIFLDLAVAQLAVLGVVAAHALDLAADGWPTQLAAAAAALVGATLLAGCERRWPQPAPW